jgi:hypothetical protein
MQPVHFKTLPLQEPPEHSAARKGEIVIQAIDQSSFRSAWEANLGQ